MNFVENFSETINLPDDIQTVSFLNETELVILICTGEVILYNIEIKKQKVLFETNPENDIRKSDDGGFDPRAKSSIYTMGDIIVVVNDYKCHGFVHNRKENYLIRLYREDYYANASKYPIALFSRAGAPHLIYGTAWNEIHIVNLSTLQVLTADKSLIEENAEQHYIDVCKKYGEGNIEFWPMEYDYFFGGLILSPNGEQFLSRGWVWGSCYTCTCNLFDIEGFISNHRIKDIPIGEWKHDEGRGICFTDDKTIAVLYNPRTEDDAAMDAPYEIRLYHSNGKGEKNVITLKTALNLDGAQLLYRKTEKLFYTFSSKTGLAVLSATGEVVFHSPDFIPRHYDAVQNRFVCYDKKRVSIYQIKLHGMKQFCASIGTTS